MDRQQTLALLSSGQEAWRAWALNRQEGRAVLEQSGKWATEHDGTPKNAETRDWITQATADFSSAEYPHTFEMPIDLSGCDFPGPASFAAAVFQNAARFTRSRFLTFTNFQGATFCSEG